MHKSRIKKIILICSFFCLWAWPAAAQSLECRLQFIPFSFKCLDADEQKIEQKRIEDQFIPESQIQVRNQLEKKETELAAAEEQNNQKVVELRIIEERIDRKLASMKKLQEEIDAARTARIEIDQKDVSKLIQYYEKIDPESASTFMNVMDTETAAQILMRMNPRKGKDIMELLKPNVAVIITEKLAGFRAKQAEAARLNDPNRDIPN